jgi:acyl transferase domain-containing protein/NAD(P)H-dependent flavin oxidoreductase YrpB (nitropropane dioxygenase family)/NAD(P)-dependent dehydrogenase (short-subunit alcohol dehydrogenase family)
MQVPLSAFSTMVVTPAALGDPALAVAAAEASAVGIVDISGAYCAPATAKAVMSGLRAASGHRGVRCALRDLALLDVAIEDVPAGSPPVDVVVLSVPAWSSAASAEAAGGPLAEWVQRLRTRRIDVLLEVTAPAQADMAEAADITGLVARGNETGGRVAEETTFVLLGMLLARTKLPVWAHGGIGLHSAAGCYTAGAAGIVLDDQLALVDESPLPAAVRAVIARMDGSETGLIGGEFRRPVRVWLRADAAPARRLQALADGLAGGGSDAVDEDSWQRAVAEASGWTSPDKDVLPIGQAASFATRLAERYGTVAGVLNAFAEAVPDHVQSARKSGALRADAPLARVHGTRYPLVQGPMTRVSDQPAFAAAIADAGALPFLALALMRRQQVGALLAETADLLGDRPWGIGILGFVPQELRDEQLGAVRENPPAFALIAGGRPDQARVLEDAGIPTYLHVPSPALLRYFAEGGARRFVLEGRECGGHVGPRSSFVLWDSAIDQLTTVLDQGSLADCHVLLAGGIHDAASAAAAATIAAPLTARGAKVGMLLGTAYVFTDEAVRCGAVTAAFQRAVIDCSSTVLLESGPGHATRCAPSPFVEAFHEERRRLAGLDSEGRREALETLSLGRLRLAAKGVRRLDPAGPADRHGSVLEAVPEADQWSAGLFMIGQVAAARSAGIPVAELHREVCEDGHALLADTPVPASPVRRSGVRRPDVAIIGMSCLLPGAQNLRGYWDNIVDGVDAIREVPEARWALSDYYDPDRAARDKVYSRWGGFLDEVPFDPMRYGIPPRALASIEPAQLLTLEAARAALADAGLADERVVGSRARDAGRIDYRERTSVVLGAGGGIADLGQRYAIRSGLPLVLEDLDRTVYDRLPEWTEDSFAGILLNVLAGRVANRFDFGGVNFTVDAACASSLAAIHLGARELVDGTSDLVLAGGVDTVQNPFGYLCFAKTHALSPTGKCRAFDESADGIVISEGVVILVLKRLTDAERHGDRIYAVLKSIAGASDGRTNGITAPNPAGQVRALRLAYAQAGISPATVGLIEAHGTGTVAGDRAEMESLHAVFGEAGADPDSCAIGSVKSMIGHTKCAAGAAGLAKAALALHHKVLPPTLHVRRPNEQLRPGSPFYVNSRTRPWFAPHHGTRRAAVSAFGFGGINFHAVLEEHRPLSAGVPAGTPARSRLPAELLVWTAGSADDLSAQLSRSLARIRDLAGNSAALTGLAVGAWRAVRARSATATVAARLAVVAESLRALGDALRAVQDAIGSGSAVPPLPHATVELRLDRDAGLPGKLAFLYPGQGSQYVDMLRDLTVTFPSMRMGFEAADDILRERFPGGLSRLIFPPPSFQQDQKSAAEAALTSTDVAQPALAAAEVALTGLLAACGVRPDMAAGHSFGEYVALWRGGVLDLPTLLQLSEARGRLLLEASGGNDGAMAAVSMDADAMPDLPGVWVANQNGPGQTVIAGRSPDIDAAIATLRSLSVHSVRIPVGCAFHSPLVSAAAEPLGELLQACEFRSPDIPVFSNTSGSPHDIAATEIRALLARHLLAPVRFGAEIEAMHAAGARTFVEVGPKGVLTGLVDRILRDRPHDALIIDRPGAAVYQLEVVLAKVFTAGHCVNLDPLFADRVEMPPEPVALPNGTGRTEAADSWVIRDGRCVAAASADGTASAGSAVVPVSVRQSAPAGSIAMPSAAGPDGFAPAPTAERQSLPAGSSPAHFLPDGTPPAATIVSNAETRVGRPRLVAPSAAHALPDEGPGRSVGDRNEIVAGFQRLMTHFLDTQREVMLAWSTRGLAVDVPPSDAAQPPALADLGEGEMPQLTALRPAAAKSPPPTEMPDRPGAQPTDLDVLRAEDATTEATPGEAVSATGVLDELRQIVSERTGYPADVLHPDQDMESDLGMDSIKRMEILAALMRGLPGPAITPDGSVMETLTGLRTLREIAAAIVELLGSAARGDGDQVAALDQPAGRPPQPQPGEAAGQDPVVENRSLARFLVEPILADPQWQGGPRPEPVILVTDDGGGIAEHLAAGLNRRGEQTVVVGTPLADRAAAADLLRKVRKQRGEVRTVVHLLRRSPAAEDIKQWRARVAEDAGTLLHLVQALAELSKAGTLTAAKVVAVAPLGLWPDSAGDCGAAGAASPVWSTADGVVIGMVRTLRSEFPATQCRIVDLDPAEQAEKAADLLLDELSRDDHPEVGYRGGRRYRPQIRPAPPIGDPGVLLPADRPSVLLVTGGARGITAEVVVELAAKFPLSFVLVGRTPLPDEPEDPATAELTDPRSLRAALVGAAKGEGRSCPVGEVESATRRLLRQREIRATLEAVRRLGAAAEYLSADLGDQAAVQSLVSDVYRRHGRIDAVIHGAGILEDRLLVDKDIASVQRVLRAKAESALLLAENLDPETTRAYLLFSSVAGLFGNKGQADYAGANVVLDLLARNLDARWPGRVAALAWGPWAAGMAAAEVQERFRQRGVEVIEPAAGRAAFLAEFAQPPGSACQVVLGDGPWAPSSAPGAAPLAWPLLAGASVNRSADRVIVERHLSVSTDRFLDHHRIDDRPVLPAAFALELFAEALAAGWPACRLSEMRDFRVLRGVILDEGEVFMRVEAAAAGEHPDGVGPVRCTLSDAAGSARYRAEAMLEPSSAASPDWTGTSSLPALPLPSLTVAEMQDRWLFHGPLLRGVVEVHGVGKAGISAILRSSEPAKLVMEAPGRWAIDPVVVDGAFQLAIIWARSQLNMTPLPTGFARYQQITSLSTRAIHCEVHASPSSNGHLLLTDMTFSDETDRLIARLTGMEFACSQGLNRLGGTR